MRTAILAATMTIALVATQTGSKQPLPPDVGAGKVASFDLTTTDVAKSKDFYGKLFGWKYATLPGMEAIMAHVMVGDVQIGTIRKAEGAISAYNGVVYIQVDDIRASCKKAQELGGKVPTGFPFDLNDGRGAIAIVTDPAGHPIGMYSRAVMGGPK